MRRTALFIILSVYFSFSSAAEKAMIFSKLPHENTEQLLLEKEFNDSILKEVSYLKLDSDKDLLAIDTTSPIFHGLWLADYKKNKFIKISFNIPKYGPYSDGDTLMFVTAGSDVRHGEVYNSVSIMSFHNGESTEKQLLSSSYMYQELENASCIGEGSKLKGITKEIKDFIVSTSLPIVITITFYERNCSTNEIKELIESYDIFGKKLKHADSK